MREILFRGKRIDNGEWAEGFLLKGNRTYIVTRDAIDYMVVSLACMASMQLVEVDPKTVGQFTGLTDMCGNKIFDGDILLSKVYEYAEEDIGFGMQRFRTGNKIDAVWSVEHKIYNAKCGYFVFGKDRRFHIPLTHSVIFNGECGVIGNIHDNPEMLMPPKGE